MPTYGYQCTECKHEFSVFQAMKDDPLTQCPECTGAIKRLLFPVGVIFKGSGWYVNDSRKPEKSSDEAPAAAKTETEKSTDSKSTVSNAPADSKPDSSTPNKPAISETKPSAPVGER